MFAQVKILSQNLTLMRQNQEMHQQLMVQQFPRGAGLGQVAQQQIQPPIVQQQQQRLPPQPQQQQRLLVNNQQRKSDKPLTKEEKRNLALDINKLSGEHVHKVIDIIKESGRSLGGQDGEVELDIETLDTATLKRLKKYVRTCLSRARAQASREDASFGYSGFP